MSTHSFSRRIIVVMMAAIVALGGIALPAAAKGGHKGRGEQQTQTVSAKGKGKARSTQARQHKRAPKFVVAGFVTTVDTAEVTVRIKGGNKSLRNLGTPVSFTVAEGARVKLNGERVALSALAAGDHVVVKGAKIGDVLTAHKVFASREEEDTDDATESDDSQETEDVTTGDDTSGTGDATTGDGTSTSDGGTTTE